MVTPNHIASKATYALHFRLTETNDAKWKKQPCDQVDRVQILAPAMNSLNDL